MSSKMNTKQINKEMTLPEMQKAKLKCVFCGASNQKEKGGYFRSRFICKNCDRELNSINMYLGLKQ